MEVSSSLQKGLKIRIRRKEGRMPTQNRDLILTSWESDKGERCCQEMKEVVWSLEVFDTKDIVGEIPVGG